MQELEMASWSDALPELLGHVLARLPFPADRARFRAVCRRWRSAARLYQPRGQLPWLVRQGGSLFSLSEAAFHPLHLLKHARISGPTDCWLTEYELLNRFSQPTNPFTIIVPAWHRFIRKVVRCSPADNLVAVLCRSPWWGSTYAGRGGFGAWAGRGRFRRLGGFSERDVIDRTTDATFHEEKLYVLTTKEDLIVVDDDGNLTSASFMSTVMYQLTGASFKYVIKHNQPIDDRDGCADFTRTIDGEGNDMVTFRYLVESHDKLLMVKRMVQVSDKWPNHCTRRLEVFEADVGGGAWTPIGSLRGRALFVGKLFSKSVEAGGDIGEDLIYFKDEILSGWDAPFGDSGVYDMRSAVLRRFTEERRPPPLTWVFPPEVVV